MRVLIDIVHPADVLFFKRPIEMLKARGDVVEIISRRKDVACDLLEEFGLAHRAISTAGRGIFGLAIELIGRDWGMLRAVRRFRPDIMVGFGGVAISHVGRLTGIPAISFYDSENAKMQTRVTWPFISRLFVPESYSGPTPAGRTTRLAGTKELSYLHPSSFAPDRDRAISCGLDPDRENFFVRTVAWQANHDIGLGGWNADTLRAVVQQLSALGRVHLSSEGALLPELEPLRYRGPISGIHHLMACCRLLVGESATMASEAAILGVPAIYCGRDFPSYVRELEAAGLIVCVPVEACDELPALVSATLSRPRAQWAKARERYMQGCPDWAQVIVQALETAAPPQARRQANMVEKASIPDVVVIGSDLHPPIASFEGVIAQTIYDGIAPRVVHRISICVAREGESDDNLSCLHSPIEKPLLFKKIFLAMALIAKIRAVRNQGVKIFHFVRAGQDFLGAILSLWLRMSDRKVVVTLLSGTPNMLGLRFAHTVLVHSPKALKYLTDNGADARKCACTTPPIRFLPTCDGAVVENHLSNSTRLRFLVLSAPNSRAQIGRRGIPLLIEACQILDARGAAIDVRIHGRWPEGHRILQSMIERANIKNLRIETAVLDNPGAEIEKSAGIIIPCTGNGMPDVPLSAMEAAALGRCVLVTKGLGIGDLLRGYPGFFEVPVSPAALADALEQAAKSQWNELGDWARCEMTRFSPENFTRDVQEIYERILGERT